MRSVLKMFDRTLLLALFASFFLVLAGCGGGEPGEVDKKGSEGDEQEPGDDNDEEEENLDKNKGEQQAAEEMSPAEKFAKEMSSLQGVCVANDKVESVYVYSAFFGSESFETEDLKVTFEPASAKVVLNMGKDVTLADFKVSEDEEGYMYSYAKDAQSTSDGSFVSASYEVDAKVQVKNAEVLFAQSGLSSDSAKQTVAYYGFLKAYLGKMGSFKLDQNDNTVYASQDNSHYTFEFLSFSEVKPEAKSKEASKEGTEANEASGESAETKMATEAKMATGNSEAEGEADTDKKEAGEEAEAKEELSSYFAVTVKVTYSVGEAGVAGNSVWMKNNKVCLAEAEEAKQKDVAEAGEDEESKEKEEGKEEVEASSDADAGGEGETTSEANAASPAVETVETNTDTAESTMEMETKESEKVEAVEMEMEAEESK